MFDKFGSAHLISSVHTKETLYKVASAAPFLKEKVNNTVSKKDDDNYTYFWTRAVSADRENLNADIFPLDELKKSYKTFVGRCLFMDHNANSIANAVGKVFDAKLLEDPDAEDELDRYYVGCLCGVDKTTHPDIAAKVAHGVIDSVSMGASCGSCQCNICNRVCHTPEEFCVHLQHQGQIDPETGKKCCSINRDVNFTELSLVGVPADPYAKMQQVFAEFVGGLNKSASLEKEAENSFLEKFSFSIPCGNEKICETLFNVLTGYKKQGISDLSMDGSILKLSVEAKNEDLAKQKLEKISEEQGLGVEQPLEKEENLMPKEEIKPVEEQVEKKGSVAQMTPEEFYNLMEDTFSDVKNYDEAEQKRNELLQKYPDLRDARGTLYLVGEKDGIPNAVLAKFSWDTIDFEDDNSVSQETIKKYKERGFVEEGTPEYDEFYNAGFTLKKSLIPGEDGKALYNVIEIERESAKKENIDKKAGEKFDKSRYHQVFSDIQFMWKGINESGKATDEDKKVLVDILKRTWDMSIPEVKKAVDDFENGVDVSLDLQEVESSKTQLNEVKEVKAEENKETKKEDLVPGVSKEDTKKDIKHDLAKEKEEAKGGEDETKDIETLEKAIKETDKGALSKVIDLLKKFIGGEAKEGEDLKDYKSDGLVKKLEEKPADKKASIEEPVNNVVNTVAEPVMDHIEAKPEVPAQPVPEVKEEVEEKKEEVKPSKDVKTKEDAVKVLEDVLKAGEEADVKELGKVLDFLKSDKKEEKKEEVKEEKVEEKAEPKKEEPVKEEKKSEVEKPLEVEAKEEPAKESEAKCEAEVKEEAKPLFANVTRVSLLKTANLIDSKWVFHFKGTDKVACLSVKNLLPGVSEKVAYLTSKEFYNEMMDTLTKKQAFDGEAVKQIVANYNEKIKVGSDEAKSQVSKATSKAKNETDGKKVSDTSKAVDTKLTDDGKAQKQDKVNSKEDAGAIESATKKAPAETDIKVSAELEAKCKQLTAALEAKEAEVSQMKMQQELAAKTAKARQIVEKSIKCGLVQCNETFRQEELLKQASPLKAKEEAMKRTADSMVADLLALSDEELDKQASYLSNFKVEAEVKQLKPIKIEASCEQSEDEDLIKALGAEMW